jgi:hypothetical protein
MPRLEFSYELPCSAEQAWKAIECPRHLQQMSRPVLKLTPEDGSPEIFHAGATIHVSLALFGLLPWGRHSITFEKFDPQTKAFETREEGGPIRVWEHVFKVQPLGAQRCQCTDDIFFEAGWFNSFLWLYGQLLYRWRYRSWRRHLLTPRPTQG